MTALRLENGTQPELGPDLEILAVTLDQAAPGKLAKYNKLRARLLAPPAALRHTLIQLPPLSLPLQTLRTSRLTMRM